MRRICNASLVAVLLLVTMGLATVGAAPENNPWAQTVTFACEGGETIEFVAAAAGAAGHVVGSNETIILMALAVEVEVDGEVVYTDPGSWTAAEGLRKQDRLITCIAEYPDQDIAFIEQYFGIDITGDSVLVRDTAEFFMPRRR